MSTNELMSLSSLANQAIAPNNNPFSLSQAANLNRQQTQPIQNAQSSPLSAYSNINIPTNVGEIIGQTAESTLQPLRAGFQKNVETLTGELAKRGVLYGGTQSPGAQQFADLASKQSQLEANVIGQLSAQFGGSLLENALRANELAQQNKYAQQQAEFSQGLQYGIDPNTGKPLTSLQGDISKATQLQGLQYGYDASGKPLTQTQAEIQMKTATSGIDVNAQKEITSFTSNLNAQNQKDYASYMQSLKNGINPTTGKVYTDSEVSQQMLGLQTKADEALFKMKNATTRGINPLTGQAYTDQEMNDIAFQNQKNMLESQNKMELNLQTQLQALRQGVDSTTGLPLTETQVQDRLQRMSMDIQNEYAKKAANDALIAQYGPEGVKMAETMAVKRGDNLKNDMRLLTTVENDVKLTDQQKSDITRLILNGAGWESDQIKSIVGAPSGSSTFQFLQGPDLASVVSRVPADYLKDKGFKYKQKSEGGFLGIGSHVVNYVESNKENESIFKKLWETDPSFRSEVAKYL